MVSLNSSSSAEIKIKKIFLDIVFFDELSRFKILCEQVIIT